MTLRTILIALAATAALIGAPSDGYAQKRETSAKDLREQMIASCRKWKETGRYASDTAQKERIARRCTEIETGTASWFHTLKGDSSSAGRLTDTVASICRSLSRGEFAGDTTRIARLEAICVRHRQLRGDSIDSKQ